MVEFAPSMRKLVNVALENRDSFSVLTPYERKMKEAKKVQAVLIARLSKEDKKKPGHSIERQQKVNKAFAKEKGFTIVGEVSDVDVTGTKFERPNYNKMKRKVMDGRLKANTFVFWMPDRFARDLLEALLEEKDLREVGGISLKFSDLLYQDIDTSTGIGRVRLYKEFLDAMKEHQVMVHRTKTALDMLKGEGIQLGSFPNHFTKDKQNRIVPTKKAKEAIRLRLSGYSWGETGRAVGISISDIRNIFSFIGRKASDVLAEQ